MLFTTATEWAALALTLLGGWLLGLASHPGGRKWRDRYNAERDAHAAYRRDVEGRFRDHDADRDRLERADARIAELERDREALDRDREAMERAQARVTELERENDRLRTTPAPIPAGALAGRSPEVPPGPDVAPAEPVPLTRRVVAGSRPSRGWFDWGPGSDPRARRF